MEALVALTVASLVALAVGHLLRGTRASETAAGRTLDPLQVLDLAAELLSEEIALAAFVPWPVPEAVADLPVGVGPRDFVLPGLVVEGGPDGDRVSVRYVADRLADGPRARAVTFEAAPDAQGEPQLYRRPGSASRQPLVAGVDTLTVTAVVQAGRLMPLDAAEAGVPVWAIVMRLWAGETSRDLTIELPHRPLGVVSP